MMVSTVPLGGGRFRRQPLLPGYKRVKIQPGIPVAAFDPLNDLPNVGRPQIIGQAAFFVIPS
jgi:hypothetical protein